MVCGACEEGKQTKFNIKKTIDILTSRPFELLHMDLMDPTQTKSLNGNKYIMVIKDVYLDYHIKTKFWIIWSCKKTDQKIANRKESFHL
jgi:hypothetical protein